MADQDSKTEDERIQAMFEQGSDQWTGQQDQSTENSSANVTPQQQTRSPQPFATPAMTMPPGFNPMLSMAMMNPHFQFQQMLMQQQLQRQQMQVRPNMGQSNIPPETQKPPVGYVCFKCGQPGHWIYYCPNVPKGQFVQRPGMNGSSNQQMTAQERPKPNELTCRICGNLMREAALVPCCGKSFCKECITTRLNETSKCPSCEKEGITSSQIIPNRTLRNTIQAFKDQSQKQQTESSGQASATDKVENGEASSQRSEQQQQGSQEISQEPSSSETTKQQLQQSVVSKGGLPIQVFESEERTPRTKGKGMDNGMMPDMMGAPPPFPVNPMMMGGPMPGNMGFMMGMPPGMNPAAAAMMRMGMGVPDQWGASEGMGGSDGNMGGPGRPPFMNPFAGPEEMWGGMPGPFPGMPPSDMTPFPGGPMNPFSTRGGFAGRGRGGSTRGGRIYGNQGNRQQRDEQPPESLDNDKQQQQQQQQQEKEGGEEQKGVEMAGPDEAIPTGPRAEREKYGKSATSSRYSRHHRRSPSRSRSRSPRRDHDRDSRRDRYSPSPSRSRSRGRRSSKSRRRSYSRSPSRSRSRSMRRHEERHSSSSSRHRSSRHHSSRYDSRERERERDRDRDRDRDRGRDRDRDRDRDRHRDRDRDSRRDSSRDRSSRREKR